MKRNPLIIHVQSVLPMLTSDYVEASHPEEAARAFQM
jgi:hypothetical protein